MSTTRRNYFLTITASLVISITITTLYHFFRPQPLTIHEVNFSPEQISTTSHTTLTGRITKNSTPGENGDYYLQTPNQLILLESDQDLLDYLATTVTIQGNLTSTFLPDDIPTLTIDSISSQDLP